MSPEQDIVPRPPEELIAKKYRPRVIAVPCVTKMSGDSNNTGVTSKNGESQNPGPEDLGQIFNFFRNFTRKNPKNIVAKHTV
jgi:hypothetical protein